MNPYRGITMQQAEEVVQRVLRRSARLLTAKQLKKPCIQTRIRGIIERAFARRGLGIINLDLNIEM